MREREREDPLDKRNKKNEKQKCIEINVTLTVSPSSRVVPVEFM